MDREKLKNALKDKLIIKLVNKARVPDGIFAFQSIGDMAKIYALSIKDVGISITITMEMLDTWGITVDELDEMAAEYAPKNRPYEIVNVVDELKYAVEEGKEFEGLTADILNKDKGLEMHVIRYMHGDPNGAAAICYKDALEEISERFGDVWTIPSSVHEMIIIKDDGIISPIEIESMIGEVNEQIIEKEDRLSDSCYHYHAGDSRIETGIRWMSRRAFL